MSKTINKSRIRTESSPNYLFGLKKCFCRVIACCLLFPPVRKVVRNDCWIIKALDYHFLVKPTVLLFSGGGEERWMI